MKIAVDLHIHTALSPCADDDMTPNNIVNMAVLKGLDAISITDHNACDNVEAVVRAASARLLVLPGMELQTREEVHLLCYFPTLETLIDFDKLVRNNMIFTRNFVKAPGSQQVMNEYDKKVGERTEPLIASVDLALEKAIQEVRLRGGVPVPAHIDRTAYGIVSQLGFIPKESNFTSFELSSRAWKNLNKSDENVSRFFGSYLQKYLSVLLFFSSDAHRLDQILEREMFLEVDELSAIGILRKLTTGCFP
jgi:PHP family Zn ribbon phosphoesterase